MPRCFFHRTDGGFDSDTEGTESLNRDAARIEAVTFVAGTVKDHPDYVWDGKDFRIEVADSDCMLLCIIVILGIDSATVRLRGTRTT